MAVHRVAFCTTCKGRLVHLRRTLPTNLEHCSSAQCVHVLLDYNSRDGLADWVRSEMQEHLQSGRLVYYRFTEPVPFQMARAKNMAHRLGIREGASVLVNMDADNFAGCGFAEHVAEQFQDSGVFLWSRMVKEGDGRLPRGISGRIAVTEEQFRLVGGYDERYSTWSPDDMDFNSRLRKLGFTAREIDQRYLRAILHTDKMRFKEYAHAEAEASSEVFELEGRGHIRVANGGSVGLGVVYRNFDPTPIVIDPIPTRVFGVGMHKTGTVSLSKALTKIGFPCCALAQRALGPAGVDRHEFSWQLPPAGTGARRGRSAHSACLSGTRRRLSGEQVRTHRAGGRGVAGERPETLFVRQSVPRHVGRGPVHAPRPPAPVRAADVRRRRVSGPLPAASHGGAGVFSQSAGGLAGGRSFRRRRLASALRLPAGADTRRGFPVGKPEEVNGRLAPRDLELTITLHQIQTTPAEAAGRVRALLEREMAPAEVLVEIESREDRADARPRLHWLLALFGA